MAYERQLDWCIEAKSLVMIGGLKRIRSLVNLRA